MKKESIEEYLYRNHTDKTAKTYLYYIVVFLMQYPSAKILLYTDIIDYVNEIRAKAKGSGSLSAKFGAVKRYYDYLLESGQRSDHPCKSIKVKRKRQPIQLQDLFSSPELEELLNRENRFTNLELRNKVIISLLIYQALSCNELVRLELSELNLDEGTVYIKSSPKLEARTLQLKPKQILLIQKYVDTSRKNLLKSSTSCLLVTTRGTKETADGIHSMIEPMKGLYPERNLNPMTIRQSVISNQLNEFKRPLEDVQLFAGHRWPSATEKYRRLDMDLQRKLINLYHPLQ
jgi:integrase/recombinase XerD